MHTLICLLFLFTLSEAQVGKECRQDYDCSYNQLCLYDTCQCKPGYVRHIDHCFKTLKYGERCAFEEQCIGDRQTCRSNNNSEQRCLCKEYYVWVEENENCNHANNESEKFDKLEENSNWTTLIHKKGEKIFYIQWIAGVSVICIGIILFALCLIYGRCCRKKEKLPVPMSEQSSKGTKEVAGQDSTTEGTYMPIFLDIT